MNANSEEQISVNVTMETVANTQSFEAIPEPYPDNSDNQILPAAAGTSPFDKNNDDDDENGPLKDTTEAMDTVAVSDDEEDKNREVVEAEKPSWTARLCSFYLTNEFLILIVCAILLARAYPPLGAEYVAADITADWLAVCLIFLMAGIGLKTDEFSKAFKQIWFNLYVQIFNFGLISSVVFVVTRGLEAAEILSADLADGLVISTCLPMTINMVVVLTKAANGDESLGIVNSAAGNMIGVVLSPALILGYLGVTGDIDLVEVLYKLALRVVFPVIVGQVIQKTMPTVMKFYKEHKPFFKRFQEYCLVFIVYAVFCETFEDGSDSSISDIFLMVLFVVLFLLSFMALAWFSSGLLFRDHPEMRVMGLFGCTHKTVAMGVPLINAIYENNAAVGLYTLPLLIWHTAQLVVGSFLAPRLAAFVVQERKRLLEREGENRASPPSSSSLTTTSQPRETASSDGPTTTNINKATATTTNGDLEYGHFQN